MCILPREKRFEFSSKNAGKDAGFCALLLRKILVARNRDEGGLIDPLVLKISNAQGGG